MLVFLFSLFSLLSCHFLNWYMAFMLFLQCHGCITTWKTRPVSFLLACIGLGLKELGGTDTPPVSPCDYNFFFSKLIEFACKVAFSGPSSGLFGTFLGFILP